MPITALHFVYNVEATPKALVKDFVHRLVDPATYPCRLCDLTYGRFVKKPGWQLFLWSLPVKARFYPKDRFIRKHPSHGRHTFPVVLSEDNKGRFSVFLSAEKLASIASLADLETEVKSGLELSAAHRLKRDAPAARLRR